MLFIQSRIQERATQRVTALRSELLRLGECVLCVSECVSYPVAQGVSVHLGRIHQLFWCGSSAIAVVAVELSNCRSLS